MLDFPVNVKREMQGNINTTNLSSLLLPLLGELFQWMRSQIRKISKTGIYEVLDYQMTLDIHDSKGKNATFSKIEKVKFLQDNIIAYQDQAWGDGNILNNYRCSPGNPVDIYRVGFKNYILISLQHVKNRGDKEEFKINWNITNGFLKPIGFWETIISHVTQRIGVQVIFPENRPPIKWFIIESNLQRIFDLGREALSQLPDRRWQLSWEKKNPRLFENYILRWEW